MTIKDQYGCSPLSPGNFPLHHLVFVSDHSTNLKASLFYTNIAASKYTTADGDGIRFGI